MPAIIFDFLMALYNLILNIAILFSVDMIQILDTELFSDKSNCNNIR